MLSTWTTISYSKRKQTVGMLIWVMVSNDNSPIILHSGLYNGCSCFNKKKQANLQKKNPIQHVWFQSRSYTICCSGQPVFIKLYCISYISVLQWSESCNSLNLYHTFCLWRLSLEKVNLIKVVLRLLGANAASYGWR